MQSNLYAKLTVMALGLTLVTSCSAGNDPKASTFSVESQQRTMTTASDVHQQPDEPVLVETYQGTQIPLDVVEEMLTPIEDVDDPELFDFPENVGLSEDEATERLDSLNEDYELGEPFSLKDLELVRAYTGTSLPSQDEEANSGEAFTAEQALYTPDQGASIASAGFSFWSGNGSKDFSTTKTSQKVSVKFNGTLYKKVSALGFNNSWRLKAKAAITKGRTNVKKNAIKFTYNSYGTVAKWPFVGRVYTTTQTIPNGTKDVSYDTTHVYDSFETNWSSSFSQEVTTKSGKFNAVP